MASKKTQQREQARNLRTQGWSLRQIAEHLGVSKGSVSVWVRDITLTDDQKRQLKDRQRNTIGQYAGARSNREKGKQRRRQHQIMGRERAKTGSPLFLMGCMLFWAEGAKKRNRIQFSNSDPNMILLFMRFLRDELNVQDSEFSIHIHCHDKAVSEIHRIESYWLDLLKLPASSLMKTYIKDGSDSRMNVLENGVCSIYVYRTDLTMMLFGAIQEYGGFDNPDWLF